MSKVVVGMSGGVDSSVAAILLQEQGHEVIGLFMRNWDSSVNNDILGNPDISNDICPQEQDYNDALRVCEKLNIPLHRIDFVKEYWDYVFKYFLEELKEGRTPNPDLMCNKYIKFDMFIEEAKKLDADFIATGHYVKLENNILKKAVDLNKDQSYFLAQVSKDKFNNVLFPLGNITKDEVRTIAKKHDLITANKKDSTGICFIGERNFRNFLKNYLPNIPGNIINIDTNEILGKHIGLMYYTIGQRRGLNIGGTQDRIFVVGKDLTHNVLYVGMGEDNPNLYSNECVIDNINWLSDNKPTKCMAKFRYRQEDNEVELEYHDKYMVVKYLGRIKAVTPGQACVFYLGDECLGSGIIKKVYKNNEQLWYL